jgi:hypothetical protein
LIGPSQVTGLMTKLALGQLEQRVIFVCT